MARAGTPRQERYGEFAVEVTTRSSGMNLPQRLGTRLWLPMLLMGLMAFPVALILGIVRAAALDAGDSPGAVAALGHVVPGVMFIGFLSILSAVVFSIARILGAFREGGGGIQQAAGRRVVTLAMPTSAKLMLGLMMMGMMVLVFAIVNEFVLAALVEADPAGNQGEAAWGTLIEGLRRFGVAIYLLSIAFGLYTIVDVIRFQSRRIRELGGEPLLAS